MANTFPAGHFYSPIPAMEELETTKMKNAFAGVLAVDKSSMLEFSGCVFKYASEFAGKVNNGGTAFHWSNDQLPPADALAYYGVLRHLKPNKVLEIGCGFSTQVAITALAENAKGELMCIEPYPREFLTQEPKITLIKEKLQAVPNSLFESLNSGDVLFIDSSHQAKCQSDVVDIFFRVLDLVKPGVYIHFHDIFYPDDYPEFWLKENGIFFNEQYMLLAYLKGNSHYQTLLPLACLVRYYTEAYLALTAGVHQPENPMFVNDKHGFIKAGSFWLKKV